MTCLVLRLSGPMQSWGIQSRFSIRDTGQEPSKSGVIGLLCAALGIDRSDTAALPPLTALQMGVRVDHEGLVSREFQTAGGGFWNGKNYGVVKADGSSGDTVVSIRWYLADAEFHIALKCQDMDRLQQLEAALHNPVWPLYLGRKSYVPSPPLCLGLRSGSLNEVLSSLPWRKRPSCEDVPKSLCGVLECGWGEGTVRMDVPLSYVKHDRRFAPRCVRVEEFTDFPVTE